MIGDLSPRRQCRRTECCETSSTISTGDVDALRTGAGTCLVLHVNTTTNTAVVRGGRGQTTTPDHTGGSSGLQSGRPDSAFQQQKSDWPSWFRHFKAVADVHGWDKDQRALQLVSYLDETAMNVTSRRRTL